MEPKDYYEEVDIQKYWLVLKRRWLPAIGIFVVTVACALAFVLTRESTYKAESKLLVKTDRSASLTGLGEGLGQLEALDTQNNPLDTQIEVVLSNPVLQETIAALNLKNEDGTLLKPETLSEGLDVRGVSGTDVLGISYQSNDPELAAAVVNKVVEIYIKSNIQSNRAEAAAARDFIIQQLPTSEAAVREADLALRNFKEENAVIALDEEESAAVRIIANLEDQAVQTQAQLADVTARSEELRKQVGVEVQQAVTLTALSQASGVQDVLTQLQEAQRQLAVEQTRYQPAHPAIANLQRRVDGLNALLQQRIGQVAGTNQQIAPGQIQVGELRQDLIADLVRIEAERLGLIRRMEALSNAQSAYRQRATVLPRLEQTQRQLQRKLEAAQTTYETLLTRLQEIRVTENQTIGNVRIISPALVPESTVAPRKKLIVAAGGFVGILLAIATAFALDLIDRSVKTVKEAKDLFGYTLLGVIPAFNRNGKLTTQAGGLEHPTPRIVARDLPRSPIAEAYQMLQANLKFLSSDKALKTIVVTSSVAKEGKSEVSANLAAAIAQVGRRVLLVDADMRRPAQHHIWGLTNVKGLSNAIVDQISLDLMIQNVMPNLHVLPCGVIPPNSVALLDSRKMASLVDSFAKDYDFVIFDTPALIGTADAAVLGKMADGVLLVVRPGVVDSASANAAKEFLKQSGQNVLGMVMNGVNVKNEPDSYFYYVGEHVEREFVVQDQVDYPINQ